MKILHSYKNGNILTFILEDGTKYRIYEHIPVPNFPETIDVKITDYCDLKCRYCHEDSTVAGKHSNLNKLLDVIKILPPGIELAIGGGNPLSHPDLKKFLMEAKARGLICNITVNQLHVVPFHDMIVDFIKLDLIKGLGISISSDKVLKNIDEKFLDIINLYKKNIIFHLIIGINKPDVINLLKNYIDVPKILLLGYKLIRRGKDFYNENVDTTIKEWNNFLSTNLKNIEAYLAFDNLAIEQLNLKSIVPSDVWDRYYMGDDFQYSMYIDSVNQEYGKSSTNLESRIKFDRVDILEYFTAR